MNTVRFYDTVAGTLAFCDKCAKSMKRNKHLAKLAPDYHSCRKCGKNNKDFSAELQESSFRSRK